MSVAPFCLNLPTMHIIKYGTVLILASLTVMAQLFNFYLHFAAELKKNLSYINISLFIVIFW
jgi:hypothetical protein